MDSVSPLRDSTIQKLEALFEKNTLLKGEHFLELGKVAKEIAFLEKGIVRAFYRNQEGQEYNKHFFVEGSFIGGYSSLITGLPNQISQEALTDCDIWVVNYTALTNLYDQCPDLERMARRLAEQFFVQKEKREIEIIQLEAKERYLIFLKEFPQIEQKIPQYQIASYLGITATQLSRVRKELSQE